MNNLQHSWEQFCKTGLVSDYLDYRRAARMGRPDEAAPADEDYRHEDHHRGYRHSGTEYR